MKILLTGATGFIGRQLLSVFIQEHHQVIITKRADSDLEGLFHHIEKIQVWDIDKSGISNIFGDHLDIDAVVHAATDYGYDATIPTKPFQANENFPMQLMTLAIQHQVKLFINLDTFFNSGKSNYDYLKAYTMSKRHFQEWGQYCGELKRIAFVNLRLFHVYGANDNTNKFIPTIVRRCLAGEQIDLTNGEQQRDFIHVDDVAAAVSFIIKTKIILGYHHYDIGTGRPVRIRDFVELVNNVCANGAILNFGALPSRQYEPVDVADTDGMNALGWRPRIDIKQGLLTIIKALS